jgi:ferredoxin
MGHATAKDIYKKLGEKIDSMWIRAPQKEVLYKILMELYSKEEADLIIKMPYGFSSLERIVRITGYNKTKARNLLDSLASKGLVIDIFVRNHYMFMPSPMVIGIFEFTMMRSGSGVDHKKMAELFHEYMQGDAAFYAANFSRNNHMSLMRTLPHEEGVRDEDYVEILDYEKASALVEATDRFAIGICSCRHKKQHLNEKKCEVPLNSCTSFGIAADYVIRHNFGKEISKSEMLKNLSISKEMGLVLNSDNTRRGIRFICQCCKCCCGMLQGISQFGYANTLITSSFLAEINQDKCAGCGNCAAACPIEAIKTITVTSPDAKKNKEEPKIDNEICLGCGVCTLTCKTKALELAKRKQRVIHPETTFERVMLQTLDKGTIANHLFDNPSAITQKAMRGIIGGFIRLPSVKRALMSDTLRSTFLVSMKIGATIQGRGWQTKL